MLIWITDVELYLRKGAPRKKVARTEWDKRVGLIRSEKAPLSLTVWFGTEYHGRRFSGFVSGCCDDTYEVYMVTWVDKKAYVGIETGWKPRNEGWFLKTSAKELLSEAVPSVYDVIVSRRWRPASI